MTLCDAVGEELAHWRTNPHRRARQTIQLLNTILAARTRRPPR